MTQSPPQKLAPPILLPHQEWELCAIAEIDSEEVHRIISALLAESRDDIAASIIIEHQLDPTILFQDEHAKRIVDK